MTTKETMPKGIIVILIILVLVISVIATWTIISDMNRMQLTKPPAEPVQGGKISVTVIQPNTTRGGSQDG